MQPARTPLEATRITSTEWYSTWRRRKVTMSSRRYKWGIIKKMKFKKLNFLAKPKVSADTS